MNNQLGAIPLSSDILKKANIGLWAFELDEGKEPRMYVDDAMLGLIGLNEQISPEETYHAWYDHIDKGSYGLVGDSVEKMTAGEHAEVQYPWHHPDGQTIIVRCGGVRNFNYTNGVRIEGTHQNVTEVIHFQEEKMAEQNAFIRYFLAPYESVYYIGLDDLLWQIYKRLDRLENKYPRSENYIESLSRYINTEVHPDDRDKVSILIQPEELKKCLAKQMSFSVTFRQISEEEEKVMQCEIVRGADDDHAAIGFRDITATELKKTEQEIIADLADQQRHIKAFGDMVNAALWSMDINENDEIIGVYWSDEFRHKFGFESIIDFPNTIEAWSDRLHPDDKEVTLNDFYHGISSRNTEAFVYDIKYRILRKNEEYCWYHAVGRMEDNHDGTRRMYGVITDISADVKLEEQNTMLQAQQKQLEEALSMAQSANRAKTTFLNSMSHDIRTPMNAIIGYTGLAASHIDNKDQVQNYLEKISQSSDHLLSLINDVLDMSRIESGKMNLEEKPEYLPDIIHTLRDIVQADIRAKQHDFFIDTINITDESVVCDKLRLNQVLLNILSNSIKYTANGGTISMRISETTVKANGYATFEFCIKDNGMGMSEDFIKTIFEPFIRGKTTTSSGIQGTGLGMAITKNIVDMMGGTINIKSELGKGTETTVIFDFKLQEAHKDAVTIPELQGVKALVADDDTNTCLSIYAMLKEIGMRAEWCTSGKETVIRAGAAYKEGDLFKIYIIDWLMPDMNGIETTRRIRKVVGNDTPIVILTAYDWSDIEDEAREAGVTAFISKPLFPSDMHKVLNECIGLTGESNNDSAIEYDFTGRKLLIVEDNEINREIATELLSELGFIIDTAEDGYIAVEKMQTAGPDDYDLVLMDVQMPLMDGYEATRKIRALATEVSKIPIVAMTANAFEEDRKLALESGMNDHVAKPINLELLKETLAKYLQ